ncbi:MAG: hypothetical protein KDB22_14485 [Planctomycetales bacterium]|nr:hypothetical protein [Planctomycetales bacterium]
MLTGVSVSCFLLSYVIALVLEASRFLFKMPGRSFALVAMLAVGLFAHSIFLVNQFFFGTTAPLPQLSNWFQWAVLGAWGLSIACLILTFRNPNRSIGLFLIPIILGLLGVAQLSRDMAPFKPDGLVEFWPIIHGVSLLVAVMFNCLGLAFGSMYLVQSSRLKKKTVARRQLRLPALEFLRWMIRLSLYTSTIGLALGLISGIVLNLRNDGQAMWFSGGVVFTFALFTISLAGTLAETLPSRRLGGRQSAYLVIANFLFLVIVLGLVLISSHGQTAVQSDSTGYTDGFRRVATRLRSAQLDLLADPSEGV